MTALAPVFDQIRIGSERVSLFGARDMSLGDRGSIGHAVTK